MPDAVSQGVPTADPVRDVVRSSSKRYADSPGWRLSIRRTGDTRPMNSKWCYPPIGDLGSTAAPGRASGGVGLPLRELRCGSQVITQW